MKRMKSDLELSSFVSMRKSSLLDITDPWYVKPKIHKENGQGEQHGPTDQQSGIVREVKKCPPYKNEIDF